MRRAVGDKTGEAVTLNSIGSVYNSLGEKQKALDFYNQALPLGRAVGDRAGETATLNNIGSVYSSLGEKQKALDFYNQALPLVRAVGDRAGEATILNNIGLVYDDLGEKQKALDFYNQALPLVRSVGDRDGEARTLENVASVERKLGKLEATLTNIEAAIELIETLRINVESKQLRSSYFATQQGAYKFAIDLLMEMHKKYPSKGYDAQALFKSERSRARNLLELLTEANVNIRQGVDAKLLEREQSIQQELAATEFRRVEIFKNQTDNKEEQLKQIKQKTQSLLFDLDEVQTQIRVQNPELASLTQANKSKELTLTLPEIQKQVLDDNTLLLQYSLGEERSYLWVVSKTSIKSYELAKGADIKAAVREFNIELRKQDLEKINPEALIKLSQMILAPAANQLEQKRLLIVGDDDLQKIPFAALPVPEITRQAEISSSFPTPLLVNHEIVNLPSVSTLGILRDKFKGRSKAPKTIAVFADPVFQSNDERLTIRPQSNTTKSNTTKSEPKRDCAVFERLKFSGVEANDIVSLAPTSSSMQFTGFAASRSAAKETDLTKYQIVHFATHGCINKNFPELSGVALSQFDEKGTEIKNNMLYLQDIYDLKLNAELVTLSACETGLGKDVRGEGLISLTRGFMYAGTKDVVVSLWNVSDQKTADLMKKFYQRMLQEGLNPVLAMREAQKEMLKQGYAPYYWAPFVVQGEWR